MTKILNESDLKAYIKKTLLKEGLLGFGKAPAEQKKEEVKIKDVIMRDGWKPYSFIKNEPEEKILRVVLNRTVLGPDPLEFEELVDDINVYFEDRNSPWQASIYGDFNDGAAYIHFTKK